MQQLDSLIVLFDDELAIDMVLNSLNPSYDQFVLTNHLNKMETTLIKLKICCKVLNRGWRKIMPLQRQMILSWPSNLT